MRTLLILVCVLLLPAAARAQTQKWVATSKTAMAITGDITVGPDTITFGNGQSIKIKPLTSGVSKLTPPADPELLEGNTLCGRPVTYVMLIPAKDGLELQAYWGAKQPVAPNGAGMCASFFYSKP